MPPHLFLRVIREIDCGEWPRPHNTHISYEDVPEFRQFIQAGCAENSTELREPLLISQDINTLFDALKPLFICELPPISCLWIKHGAELEHLENLTFISWTFLLEDH